MTSKIKTCHCPHKYQDEKYGKMKRVHNESKEGSSVAWTCTVCGKKKSS